MPDNPIHFGPFSLDAQDGFLLRGEERVHLRPQAVRVLTHLVAHQGQLVPRRDLTDMLWADTRIDEDHGLNAVIRNLRQALEDDSANPRYIETIPRKGYRFIARCTTDTPAHPPRTRPAWLLPVSIALGLISAIVALVIIDMSSTESHSPTLDEIPQVARQIHVAGLNDYLSGDMAPSRRKFEEVVSLAPDFAEGHLLLGKSTFFALGSNLHSAEAAEPHLREALRLKPELSSAHVVLGRIAIIKRFDIEKATRLANKALSMDPSDTTAMRLLAETRIAHQDPEGAIAYLKMIDDVDPLHKTPSAVLGWVLIVGGNYEAAVPQCRSELDTDAKSIDALSCLFDAYFNLGVMDLARQYAANIMKLQDASADDILFVEQAEASEAIEKYLSWRLMLAGDQELRGGALYPLVLVHHRLGDTQEAANVLRKIVEERHFPSITRLTGDVRLAGLTKNIDLRSEFSAR